MTILHAHIAAFVAVATIAALLFAAKEKHADRQMLDAAKTVGMVVHKFTSCGI